MCCLIVLLAGLGPRILLILMALLGGSWWQKHTLNVETSLLCVGWLFLPFTTFSYVLLNTNGFTTIEYIILGISILFDISQVGISKKNKS